MIKWNKSILGDTLRIGKFVIWLRVWKSHSWMLEFNRFGWHIGPFTWYYKCGGHGV